MMEVIGKTAEWESRSSAEDVSREEVLDALERINRSHAFSGSERLRRFISFLVTDTLNGNESRIKAYSIGVEVLGRTVSFDPQKDSIVRIEATRLRRELEHYYLTEGKNDPVVISVPKGTYVPTFSRQGRDHATPEGVPQKTNPRGALRLPAWKVFAGLLAICIAAAAAWLLVWVRAPQHPAPSADLIHTPALIVDPLVDLTPSAQSDLVARGLTERIIEQISKFREIAVIPGESIDNNKVPVSRAGYQLDGTFRSDQNQIMIQMRLVDRVAQKVIWADSYNVVAQSKLVAEAEANVANEVAAKIAEPNGLVFEAERAAVQDATPDNWKDYVCVLNAYAYRATLAVQNYDAVRACLEQTVERNPNYSTAWALLSLIYLDELRYLYRPNAPDDHLSSLTLAYNAARRATELDPTSVRADQALMMALYFRKDYDAAFDVGQRALSLNPNDLEFKGELGLRLALYGKWNEGCPLVEQTLNGSLRRKPYYETALAICRFFQNDIPAAARLIVEADVAGNPVYHIWATIILTENGKPEEAAQHRQWLSQNASGTLDRLLKELPTRLVREQDRLRAADALRKAGLLTP